jgi:hypothetical protein
VKPTIPSLDGLRKEREDLALQRVWGASVRPCVFRDAHPASWDYYGIVTTILGWRVIGRYHQEHPYRAPKFWTDPPVRTHHLIHDSNGIKYLCLWHRDEWNRDWTMATALGVVHRFLGLLQRGKVD